MATTKPPTTFSTLPAELRNEIYELSGCLDLVQCLVTRSSKRANEFQTYVRADCASIAINRALTDRPAFLCIRQHPATRHGRSLPRFLPRIRPTSICDSSTFSCFPPAEISQPSLTKVSIAVRADTLPIYYGKHIFYAFISDVEEESASLLRWLSIIGPHNASLLRNIILVYCKKTVARYIIKDLQPEMARLGVRVGDAVKLRRTDYPHCNCDECIRSILIADEAKTTEISGSEAEGYDIETTGLIATRAKRSTAGNLYAALRPNLDDPEIRKELLADEDDDEGEYDGSDAEAGGEEDEDALESSSSDDDAGPPQEGDAEDLQGEKELKKEERAKQLKKRKIQDARLKVPVWQQRKKVKLADDVKTEDGAPARPQKKSERSNWLPTEADAPKRQSHRSLAVQNREKTYAHAEQHRERSEKQKTVMKNHAERVVTKERRVMTLSQRLEACAKIAKQTDKEFGRLEREEAERQKARDAQLAAKLRKNDDGSFVRHWSGSAVWRGEKMEERRVRHGSVRVEEIHDTEQTEGSEELANGMASPTQAGTTTTITAASTLRPIASHMGPATHPASSATPSLQNPPSWLSGIHDFAAQPPAATPQSTPNHRLPPSHDYTGWPPSAPPVQPPVPSPTIREQAQRSLVILSHFQSLDQTPTAKKPSKSTTAGLTSTDTTAILLPDSYPPFTADELRYLLAKHTTTKKRGAGGAPSSFTENLPVGPERTRCAILSSQVAKYRDPATGVPYLDLQCYKILQRVVAGGCAWSGLLGAWVGPSAVMGRPARGVPEGFGTPAVGRAVVKVEGAG
ncbi:hypothetical protein LTR91_022260 [Friedmanniomyces endolithicus]|uniref:Vps72/YL1 C-terminal domain-containing protein n=1 Tax=Friedmanniomyces endolithicus TaxID=329885 RepID=A0AAN6FQ88_9PEZI|nr:hypothetical protein LTS00_009692 [Friedmanniomyces endolithicus]KAK0310494.1 hypothetical protein LTR01_003646 [Friedmanniomyces endolithicus]KAK0320762.1 hypothetical protein LTR82_008080 [Friedmanniomyces endolithicus]KAK0919155.1 hypothetical protein LTR57_011065 [Friedmanniomyces endolithicus]KAK0956648.1 hypothetical protein LTR91_022260 [Friedmanniomyces endolithicus]